MSGAVLNTLPCSMGGAHAPLPEPYVIGTNDMILQRTGNPLIRDALRTSETLKVCSKCHALLFTPELMTNTEVVKRLPHIYQNITENGPELLDLTARADARALKGLQAPLARHIMDEQRKLESYFFNLA